MEQLLTDLLPSSNLYVPVDDFSSLLDALESKKQYQEELLLKCLDTSVDKNPETSELLTEIHATAKSIDEFQKDIEQTIRSFAKEVRSEEAAVREEKTRLEDAVCTVENSMASLEPLLLVSRLLKDIDDATSDMQYDIAADLINRLNSLHSQMKRTSGSDGSSLNLPKKFFVSLHEQVVVKREQLIYTLEEFWGSCVHWKQEPTEDNSSTSSLEFTTPNKSTFHSVIIALHTTKCLQRKLDHFCKNLVQLIMDPILNDNSALFEIKSDSISVTCKSNKSASEEYCDIESASKRLEYVKIVMEFVLNQFPTTLPITGDQNSTEEQPKFAKLAGRRLTTSLTKSIVSMLRTAVPFNLDDLKDFKKVMDQASELYELWRTQGWISADVPKLIEQATDIDNLFINRRCQKILGSARDLIKADYLKTRLISAPEPTAICSEDDHSNVDEKLRFAADVDALPVIFPWSNCKIRCPTFYLSRLEFLISETIYDLMALLRTTLTEACEASPSHAGRLCHTVRNAVEIFADITLQYHRDRLSRLPAYSAILYTNCMYIVRQLVIFTLDFEPRLKQLLGRDLECQISNVDLVPRLKQMGSEAMAAQLSAQKATFDEIVTPVRGFHDLSANSGVCTKCLKQITHLLNHLHTIWIDILPAKLALRGLAVITNHVLQKIMNYFLSMEDIASTDSEKAVDMFILFLGELSPLFKVNPEQPSEISVHCSPAFQRFEEMLKIFSGSLQDISDRWADGQGPLALYFQPNEIHGFIRALFQNTDRRAAVISRISL